MRLAVNLSVAKKEVPGIHLHDNGKITEKPILYSLLLLMISYMRSSHANRSATLQLFTFFFPRLFPTPAHRVH